MPSSARLPVRNYGKFLSTLDELDTDQARGLRHCGRQWIERSDVVLRDAKILEGRLSTGPAGAVPARHSRDAAGNGLPILSQLCRNGGALECAQHPDLHELPYPGAEGQPEA